MPSAGELSCIFIRLNSAPAQQHVHRFEKRGLDGLYAAIDCDAVDIDQLVDQLDM
jgi:hypothetical protein